MQPRIRLPFWAASAHCQLMLSFSSTSTPKSFSSGLLSSHSPPSLYLCLGLLPIPVSGAALGLASSFSWGRSKGPGSATTSPHPHQLQPCKKDSRSPTRPCLCHPPAWINSSHQEPSSGLCLPGDHGDVCRLSIWLGTEGGRPSRIAPHRSCFTSAWWPYLWCGLGVVTTPPSTCQFLAVICCLSWISRLFSASWLSALSPVF